MLKRLLLAALAAAVSFPAHAQVDALAVSGDPTYDAGRPAPVTQTTAGRLRVDSTGDSLSAVNAANSSTTPLGISGVFTGTAFSTLPGGCIAVSVTANQVSATDGLSIQQSPDGTNWDISDVYTLNPAPTGANFCIPTKASFGRVVYTNGGVAQTVFRLQTILKPQMPVASAFRPADGQSIQNDFPGGLSIQQLYNGTSIDLTRSVSNATNSTGTGIAAVGLVGQFDDVSIGTVTENQFGNLRMSPHRALAVSPYSTTGDGWSYAAAASGIAATTTAVTIKASAGAGLRNYITGISVQTATLGNATELAIRDGAGGTVLWRTQLQTTALPLVQIDFPNPIRGTAATLLEVVTLTSATGGVYFNAQGFAAP